MHRPAHTQPNATSSRPPANTTVHTGERGTYRFMIFTTHIIQYHSAMKALPSQGRVGRGFFGARYYDAGLSVWLSVDPLAHKYPSMSAYMYCAGNPVMLVDPDGRAWKPTINEETGEYTGYEWIAPSESYNEDGSLKEGLYHQAIFFSHGTYNPESKSNIGSSTATVYKSDGTTTTFAACTFPSSTVNYPTVPAGLYEARYGIHNGTTSSYPALRIGTVELGSANPAHPNRTHATGINVHKPGSANETGMLSGNRPISAGCLLIDYNDWSRFIKIFNSRGQRNNTVSITVSRTLREPLNENIPRRPPPLPFNSEFIQPPNEFTRNNIPAARIPF